jgi:molecular chaperone DnaK
VAEDWTLAIDFGTTFTVAAVGERGRVSVLDVEGDGSSRTPSAVWLGEDGTLVSGSEALHQAIFSPERGEPTPKRRVGEGQLLLGAELVSDVAVVAAVYSRVAAEASRQRGGGAPREVWVTHPAEWAEERTGVLLAAAQAAGLPDPQLIAEPVAAALRIGARRVAVGEQVAVYDFGGGTFDAAILRREPGGFEVAGPPTGRDPLGGENIDRRIIDYLGTLPVGEHPDWPHLLRPGDERWRRHAAALRAEVRKAKEGLSRLGAWQLLVPGIERKVQLTRDELDELVGPFIDQTIAALEEAIAEAGCEASDLAGIYLVGGSSRIPLVADRVWERFGRRPDVEDDPKTVVAMGAAGPAIGEASQPTPTTSFVPHLALATRTRSWSGPAACSATLLLRGPETMVQLTDQPAAVDAQGLAQAAAARWAGVPGYRERALVPATVLGVLGGLERTLVADHGGSGVRWLERYVVRNGRALVVTAHERARWAADLLSIGHPRLDPARHYEPCLHAECPEGWAASEQLELVRSGSGHRIEVEGRTVAPGTTTAGWARERVAALAKALGSTAGSPRKARVFGLPDGVCYTLPRAGEELTRVWYLVHEGRGYTLTCTLPKLDAIAGFTLMQVHAVLATAPAPSGLAPLRLLR